MEKYRFELLQIFINLLFVSLGVVMGIRIGKKSEEKNRPPIKFYYRNICGSLQDKCNLKDCMIGSVRCKALCDKCLDKGEGWIICDNLYDALSEKQNKE